MQSVLMLECLPAGQQAGRDLGYWTDKADWAVWSRRTGCSSCTQPAVDRPAQALTVRIQHKPMGQWDLSANLDISSSAQCKVRSSCPCPAAWCCVEPLTRGQDHIMQQQCTPQSAGGCIAAPLQGSLLEVQSKALVLCRQHTYVCRFFAVVITNMCSQGVQQLRLRLLANIKV